MAHMETCSVIPLDFAFGLWGGGCLGEGIKGVITWVDYRLRDTSTVRVLKG